MQDYLIKSGTILDGTGAPAYQADLSIKDGIITAIGALEVEAKQTLDATGAIVTPGWVDIHTHYDGQVTWDGDMNPSASHGVSTIVMGNCGVGFAPVAPSGHRDLIELMEGVEDIPGTALYEGMPWGAWETYPEYLDFLAKREYALDISSLVAHGAIRNYVMGARGRNNEAATAEDLAQMQELITEALNAGAVGFSTSRILGHRSTRGEPVPGTFANDVEILAIAAGALKRAGKGVFQIIPSSTLGSGVEAGGEPNTLEDEVALIQKVSQVSGRPTTFTLFQVDEWTNKWREVIDTIKAGNLKAGQSAGKVYPQVGSRPTGIVLGLKTYHSFMRKPTYLKLKHLPFDELLAAMRRTEIKAALLTEESVPHEFPGTMENGIAQAQLNFDQTYVLDQSMNYEPAQTQSFAALAAANQQNGWEYFYDYLVGADGCQNAVMFFTNYSDHNLDAVRDMLLDDTTVTGLSDAGAHVSLIFDAVAPTYQLVYWGRDRTRGPILPLPHLIHRQTLKNAQLFGFHDRGSLEVGKRADINVIDFDNLKLGDMQLHHDLPAGGARFLQGASGYIATLVNGVLTRRYDQDTGARPGRLVRS
jgi:N-acyl-D-amino-acid deacylase